MLKPAPYFCLYWFPGKAERHCQLTCAQVFSCQCIFQTALTTECKLFQGAGALPTRLLCTPESDLISRVLSPVVTGLEPSRTGPNPVYLGG